jgi:hypothetical protein
MAQTSDDHQLTGGMEDSPSDAPLMSLPPPAPTFSSPAFLATPPVLSPPSRVLQPVLTPPNPVLPTITHRKRRSKAWKHFEEDAITGEVTCEHCLKRFCAPGGSTSSMMHHLRARHPDVLAEPNK